ncbi:hypothetical protein DX980_07275 [Burkholderia gladioli]|uniref:hypothetical protein n=1 Tax=Burkholderia gladioli TaxID=28095 RepID=UPI001364C78B|nr:hypothetical protein [Burkholderia gladioli]KAF1062774.1 hypothetical protein LvStA_01408 [Burkholderia gladioli]WAG19056.1 hypothetical protein DX980_07275 [Burkholderia gladioli]
MSTPANSRINWSAASVVLTAALAAGGSAFAVNQAYFNLSSDVRSIKEKNAAQDDRMSRIEKDQADQRNNIDEKLRDINADLKEVRNYLMNNQAGSRPDTRRWAR